jgi:hypothetical protein
MTARISTAVAMRWPWESFAKATRLAGFWHRGASQGAGELRWRPPVVGVGGVRLGGSGGEAATSGLFLEALDLGHDGYGG